MKSYQLIHQLINLVEELEQENPEQEISMRDFTGFLVNKVVDPIENPADVNGVVKTNNGVDSKIAHQLDNNIGRLFIFMSRYAKIYIKKALEGTPLQSAEEFTALAILRTHDHLSKTELINYNLQEKTSGTEVIRRLIAAGLVKQWDDAVDKRSKHIAITGEGKKMLYQIFLDITHVSKLITGELTRAEKFTLQYLLQKLENFHMDHYDKKTIMTKDDLRNVAEIIAIAQ
jgi:DNA-binding MarR family transcriptional regulator